MSEEQITPNATPIFAPAKQPEPPPGRQYIVPDTDDLDYLDADAAETRLKQLHSDIAGDPRHPYMSTTHPLHRDFLDYSLKLHERAAEGRENIYEKAYREGEDLMAKKRQKLRDEYENIADKLRSLPEPYDYPEAPEEVEEYSIRGMREQLLLEQGKFKELHKMLSTDMQKLRPPAGVQAAYDALAAVEGLDADAMRPFAELVIFWAYNENENKYGSKKQ